MDENDFAVKVTFNGVEYPYAFGSQAYIFHTSVYNNIHKKYGMDGLLRYVTAVHECYIDDDNRTPLGALGDYIAKHWSRIKSKGKRAILEEFYDHIS